jgi:hypothetical protein
MESVTDAAPTFAGRFRRAVITAGMILSLASSAAFAQAAPAAPAAPRAFQEQDAAGVMDRLRQALETENRTRLYKLFDNSRMPGFALFRDEVAQFFGQYQAPRVAYRINQVSQDGALGAITAEFIMEALPLTDGLPALHRRAQMRLVTSWDGKEWKVADLSPRSLFR